MMYPCMFAEIPPDGYCAHKMLCKFDCADLENEIKGTKI